MRGRNNKNRQTSIFEFQFIAKSREGLLKFCNSYMVYGHFWLHLPRDDHLPTSSYGSSPLSLKFKFTSIFNIWIHIENIWGGDKCSRSEFVKLMCSKGGS